MSRSLSHRSAILTAVVLFPLVNVGCHTAILDMRSIEEPVMMNALPYGDSSWTVKEVEGIRAKVTTEVDDLSLGDHTWTSNTRKNMAEVNVYEKIGGHDSRAVSNAWIKVSGNGVNLLFYMAGGITIDLNGTVIDLDSESDEPKGDGETPVSGDESLPEANE